VPPTFNLSHDQTLQFKKGFGFPLQSNDDAKKSFAQTNYVFPHEWLIVGCETYKLIYDF
tara:strand:+ start:742 stop:918 length:177 start_codon:yes stop_codon:yes gene_type:complete